MEVEKHLQWSSIFFALLCQFIFALHEIWIFIISSLILGAIYFLIRKITKDKLGPADVLFGFFQGLFLHPIMLWVCLAIETVLALIIENKKIGHNKFPFIPYMAAGLIVAYLIQIFRGIIF